MDFFGFFNGKISNTTLIPDWPVNYLNDVHPIYNEGGDRHPSESHTKAGTLVKIVYPTGGYTEYEYQMHRLNPNSAPQLRYPHEYIKSTTSVRTCSIENGPDFTISDASGGTVVKLSLTGSVWGDPQTCPGNSLSVNVNTYHLHFVIFNVNDLQTPYYTVGSGYLTITGENRNHYDHIYLPNGQYRVRVYRNQTEAVDSDASINVYPGDSFTFTVSGIQYKSANYKPGGGLRLREIRTYDSPTVDPIVRTFDYMENGVESGRMNIIPAFSYDRVYDSYTPVGTVHTSNSISSSYYTGVGYSQVTEYHGKEDSVQGVNGKVVYTFTNPDDLVYLTLGPNNIYTAGYTQYSICYSPGRESDAAPAPMSYGLTFPFTPPVSHNWRRGLLKTRTIFAYVSGDFSKRSEEINTYKDDYYGDPNAFNAATDVVGEAVAGGPDYSVAIYPQYYYIPSRLVKLVRSENITYDNNGEKPVSTITEYYYDNLTHLQPSRTIQTTSHNKKLVNLSLYPEDYANGAGFIGEMKSTNIRSSPVESVTYQTDSNDGNVQILSAQLTTYYSGSNVGKPSDVRVLETKNPVALAGFRFSNQSSDGTIPDGTVGTEFTVTNIDEFYSDPKISYFYETEASKLTTVITENNSLLQAYLWGYNYCYPVAKIIGTEFNTAYNILTTAQKDALINPSSDQQVRDIIQTIRSHPSMSGATVYTYTYDPLVGMTSMTDQNNYTTFYEYDSFGRVAYIKDSDSNIVKKYEYNYQAR